MSNLSDFNSLIEKRYETYPVLKRKYGIIKEIISYAKAVVTLEDGDMTEIQAYYIAREKERRQLEEQGLTLEDDEDQYPNVRNLALMNKTGEILEVGDAVWVYYWHDLADGYIAMRCGLSNGRTRAKYTVRRLAVMPPSDAEADDIYAHTRIYAPEQWDDAIYARRIIIDEKHDLTFLSGNPSNRVQLNSFLVNGFPVTSTDYLTEFLNGGMTDYYRRQFYNQLKYINPKLFTRRILINCYYMGVYNSQYTDVIELRGDMEFGLGVYATGYGEYMEDITVTHNGQTYRCSATYVSPDYPDIPTYVTPEQAQGSAKLVLISHNRHLGESIDLNLGLVIGVLYENGAWFICGAMYNRSSSIYRSFIGANFRNENEYMYAAAVTGDSGLM